MHRVAEKCFVCGNPELEPVLNLGAQALTGVFPSSRDESIETGPLTIVKCREHGDGSTCGLLQLKYIYELGKLYGDNYGYRSGLNRSMVEHLHSITARVAALARLKAGDLVVDIGSNDSTLLQGYTVPGLRLLGVDPTGKKFGQYYPAHIGLVPDFFSAAAVRSWAGSAKAAAVTSIAMFYDLEDPQAFMRDVFEVLDGDGIWFFEQSYMPTMLEATAYDTICHEHLEYYGLRQIVWMADRVGFEVIDVELNDTNGGSFAVTMAKKGSRHRPEPRVAGFLAREKSLGLDRLEPFVRFADRVRCHRERLVETLRDLKKHGKKVLGYGASTKGNVILQYCGLTAEDLPCIGEVNRDKFGCFTPGTKIPIVSEQEVRALKPDHLLVLPWHFRKFLVEKEADYLRSGGRMIFPLPDIEIV